MSRALLLLALLGPLSCTAAEPPARLVTGRYALEFSLQSLELRLVRDDEELLRFPLDAFQLGTVNALDDRASHDPYWLEYGEDLFQSNAPPDLRWLSPSAAAVEEASEGALVVALEYEDGLSARLALRADATGRFGALLLPVAASSGPAIAWMRLRPRASSEEAFYGLGEWPDDVNHRGKVRPMQIELAPTESSNNENHVPVPLLIGSRGWGLFVESRRVGLFDVATKAPDLLEITFGTAEESGKGLAFHLYAAQHPLDVPKLYYDTTGYPLLPASWALGPWIWRDESRDQAQVLSDVGKIRELDLATSAIWIDRPYQSAVGLFDFEPGQFPDPAMMIRVAHESGLRVALWQVPYLSEQAEPLRSMAQKAGYFPKKSGLLLNQWGEPIDFTNPQAFAFWQDLIGSYTRLGIEGYKLDYAEDVAPALGGSRNIWRFADGSDERVMHYGYTLLYHRVYAETLPREGGFLLCRAGRWGDQKHVSVIWPGDMDATFTRHREPFVPRGGEKRVVGVGGLPATLIQGLSLSASGFPFFGADTGGYRHSPPDRELYIRWFQQTALSTVMQVGDSSSQPPWEWNAENGRDQETLDLYRQYARLHLRLFPYEWTYAKNMLRDGRPIQRALGLSYPELGTHPSDTYLFGDDLLVAPVLSRGERKRKVVLPPGDWVDYWDGTLHEGGQGQGGGRTIELDAPLSRLPLLLRAGAIVPLLRPTIDTLSPATVAGIESYASQPGILYVRIVPSVREHSFELFDGTSIRHSQSTRRLEVRSGETFRFGAVLEVLRAKEPRSVATSAGALPRLGAAPVLEASERGWYFEPEAPGTLWIKLPAGEHQVDIR